MAHYEEQLTHRVILSGHMVEVWQDRVELENGRTSLREVVAKGPAVCVLARQHDQIWFVKQYRYPIKEELLELPAGKLDEGETPEEGALRELKEETGLVPERLISLGYIWPSPGCFSEKIYLYYADGLDQQEAHPDEDELLTVCTMPMSQVKDLLIKGAVCDGKSVAALALAMARGLLD